MHCVGTQSPTTHVHAPCEQRRLGSRQEGGSSRALDDYEGRAERSSVYTAQEREWV